MTMVFDVYQLRNDAIRKVSIEEDDSVLEWIFARRTCKSAPQIEPTNPDVGDTYYIPNNAEGPVWSKPEAWGKIVVWTQSQIWEGFQPTPGFSFRFEDTGNEFVIGHSSDFGPLSILVGVDVEATRDNIEAVIGNNALINSITPVSTDTLDIVFLGNTVPFTTSAADIQLSLYGVIDITTNPTAGEVLVVAGVTYVYDTDITIGIDEDATAAAIAAVLDAVSGLSATATANVVTVGFDSSPINLSTNSAGTGVILTAELLVNAQPALGETLTLGPVVYTFV